MYDIIIIGAGIAGLTAALYACRAGKSVVVLEQNLSGGQALETEKIENFPGFSSISGRELIEKTRSQAESFGAKILENQIVLNIYRENDLWCVETEGGETDFRASALIIASGTTYRRLDVPGEAELTGRGVSYCATCDGALYKGKTVAVYGGGNSAAYSALYLSSLAEKVYLIHRREQFRADQTLVEKLEQNDKIEFKLGHLIEKLEGETKLETIHLTSGETLKVDGLFVNIGRVPDLSFTSNLELQTSKDGFLITDENRAVLGHPGLFAAGDCVEKPLHQLITAASDGATAASSATKYLDAA